MADEVKPQATPITNTGEAEWFPPVEDDAAAATTRPTGIRYVFYGKDGLRAGWSILLFVFEFAVIAVLISMALHALHLAPKVMPSEAPPIFVMLQDYSGFVAAALAALTLGQREKRRFAVYGLGSIAGRGKQFGLGLGWGLVMLGALVGLLSVQHVLVFHGQLLTGMDVLKWGAAWLLAFLGVAFFEEFLMRGYLQYTLARGVAGVAGVLGMGERPRKVLGFWAAALFFSFVFGLGHKGNAGESPIGLLSAGLVGLVFAFSLWRTGSLWWAVGYHAAWDWAQSFLFGVRDSGMVSAHRLMSSEAVGPVLLSGGLTGPEGSVYVLGAVALTAVVIAVTLKPQAGSASVES